MRIPTAHFFAFHAPFSHGNNKRSAKWTPSESGCVTRGVFTQGPKSVFTAPIFTKPFSTFKIRSRPASVLLTLIWHFRPPNGVSKKEYNT